MSKYYGEIGFLKELVYELEEELQVGDVDEAVATLTIITGACSFLYSQLNEESD